MNKRGYFETDKPTSLSSAYKVYKPLGISSGRLNGFLRGVGPINNVTGFTTFQIQKKNA